MYEKLAKENLIVNNLDCEKFCRDIVNAFNHDRYNNNKGYIVSINRVDKKNTEQQLRGYWRLIETVWLWMRSQGNLCSKEEVSNYFKILAGHYRFINDIKAPRSIALSSGATSEDMRSIIDTIEQFGAEFGVPDCKITPEEWNDIDSIYNQARKNA